MHGPSFYKRNDSLSLSSPRTIRSYRNQRPIRHHSIHLASCSSLTQITDQTPRALLFVAMPRFPLLLFLALFTEKPIFPIPEHRRMFFSRPNELHPSGSSKTGQVIAKHVPVRSISISLIYFSEATRYTRTSVAVVGEPPPEDRSLRASASNNVLSWTQQHWDTRARLGVPQRRERKRERRMKGERESVYKSP